MYNTAMKKLYKSKTDRVWKGVLGGIGEFFEVDPTILRLLFVLLVIFTGIFPGVIFYLFAVVIMPEAPKSSAKKASTKVKK